MSAPARRAPPSLSLALASVGVLLGALAWWAPPLKRPAPSPEERLSDAWLARLTPLALSKPAPLSAPPLRELSGLVESARHPGVFWAHNDSLDAPRLFALTSQGSLITERRVLGARNVDWEDITVARDHPQGLLFVADSGDNFHWREERSVYVVREPASLEGDAPLSVVARLPYVFPQDPQQEPRGPQERGGRPPLALKERCRDSEALFWAEGGLYLIGKCFWGGRAPLYQLPISAETLAHLREPPLSGSHTPFTALPQPLKLLQSLELGPSIPPNLWRVTAADFHPQRHELAVLTYGGLWRFKWRSPQGSSQGSSEHKREGPARAGRGWRFEGGARAKQCEALAWRHEALEAHFTSPARLLMTNEQRELFELSLEP